MGDVLVGATAILWIGCMAAVAVALGDRAGAAQRREARLALSVAAALPVCFAVTPLAGLSRRSLVAGVVELVDEIGDALRWLFGLNTEDALWVLERAWRVVVFVAIIGLAIAMVLGALWCFLWFLRFAFNALNLIFEWTRIPWVLPEVPPPSWTLSPDRADASVGQRQRFASGWSAVKESMSPRSRPTAAAAFGSTAGRTPDAASSAADFDADPGDSYSDRGSAWSDLATGRVGLDELDDETAEAADSSGRVAAGGTTGRRPAAGKRPQRVGQADLPPLPPLPALTAEGRFRLSTAALDLRPATGVPRLDRRWLAPTEPGPERDPSQKAPIR